MQRGRYVPKGAAAYIRGGMGRSMQGGDQKTGAFGKIARSAMIRAMQWANANRKRWERLHQASHLTFKVISDIVGEIRRLDPKDRYLIHKSPTWNGRQSSAYYIMRYKGNWVYTRISDHWGSFSTPATCDEVGCGDPIICDERHMKSHHWNLIGGRKRKTDGRFTNTSQAGYIVLCRERKE